MESLESLYAEYKDCRRCDLAESRLAVVFGAGNPQANLFLLAERPGGLDEITGAPFSGPAGDMLYRILAAPKVEIPRQDIYITNIVLCRPPQDRSPRAGEIKACSDRLWKHIELVDPRIIVAMGRLPMIYFLGVKGKLEELRGWYETLVRGRRLPVFLTLNPASALYGEPEEIKRKKAMMYRDWQEIARAFRAIKAHNGSAI